MGCGCGCGGGKFGLVIGVAAGLAAAAGGIAGLSGSGTPPAGDAPKPASAPAQPAKDGTPAGAPAPGKDAKAPASVHDFTMKRIDGTSEALSAYAGKVVLIVNVASKCGYTKQYEGLQKLYTEKKDAGLVILGFPANDFGGQEPGSNSEIATFCTSNFGVTFPMFEKIDVAGAEAHPLFKFLAAQPAPAGGEPKWNFTKYLVGRDGKVVQRFDSKVSPQDAELVKKIDELLAAKVEPAKKDAGKDAGTKDGAKKGG